MIVYFLEDKPEKQYKSLSELIKQEHVNIGDRICSADIEVVGLEYFISAEGIEDAIRDFAEIDNCIFDIVDIPESDYKNVEKAIAKILMPYAKGNEFEICHEIKDRILKKSDFKRAGIL